MNSAIPFVILLVVISIRVDETVI
ncbi:uncharacterized protein METZ01_LOCUS212613 [marine metagenome]|uniref:Uncharacterized protein n=1 Tax=marine metagenome TaxID=408172 RepID=A0A382FAR6_9ZZZZ